MMKQNLIELVTPIKKELEPMVTPIQKSTTGNGQQLAIPNQEQIKSYTYYNDIIVLDNVPEYEIQDYDIGNDKDFSKYISDIERIIRTSFEYRHFVNYLRDYMNMNACSFFGNVSNKTTFKIKIELHHSPFTLFDIVMTIFNKRLFYNESLEVEMVAKEAMYIHYMLMVGIIPLAETVHELVHNQLIFIPMDKVMGNYEAFIDYYGEWIPPETMDKIQRMREATLVYNEKANTSILEQSPIVLQLPEDTGNGLYDLPTMKEIEALMADRILEIKENHYKLPVKMPTEE